jgi:hypothetical protein
MIKITIDDQMLAKLRNLTEPLELCDQNGKVLAHVNPAMNEREYSEPQISREEADRRLATTEKRYSTAEVLAILEK